MWPQEEKAVMSTPWWRIKAAKRVRLIKSDVICDRRERWLTCLSLLISSTKASEWSCEREFKEISRCLIISRGHETTVERRRGSRAEEMILTLALAIWLIFWEGKKSVNIFFKKKNEETSFNRRFSIGEDDVNESTRRKFHFFPTCSFSLRSLKIKCQD